MILIRHGQSIFNVIFSVTRVDPGVPDPLLTSRGRGQARDIAASLAGQGVERIVTSPYRRAIQTADTVARALGVPVAVDADVRERFSFSCDHGTPRSELARAWPEYDFDHLEERWWPRSEEREPAFSARCARFAGRMADSPAWSRTAVITHWGVIRALTGERVTNGTLVRLARAAAPGTELVRPKLPC